MKVNSHDVEVTNVGIKTDESMTFSAKLTGKSFDIIIAQIYSNKVGAVVREICSNAIDAHKAANNSNPYYVTLPTGLHPYFEVKDYGVGLEPNRLQKIMRTVFESTKDDDNNMIGGFGLGSKTPYTITDTYEISTRWNGRVYHFLSTKNENGIPIMIPLGDNETDEPNGLTIRVPVQDHIRHRFRTELKNQLRFFEDKPIVIVDDVEVEFDWYNLDIDVQFENVCVLRNNLKDYSQTVWIVMGGVGYPVDMSLIENHELSELFKKIGTDIVLYVDIGVVQPAPSRETIDYTEKSIEAVRESFANFAERYMAQTLQAFETCETDRDKYEYISKRKNNKLLAWAISHEINKDPSLRLRYAYSDGTSLFSSYDRGEFRDHSIVFPNVYFAFYREDKHGRFKRRSTAEYLTPRIFYSDLLDLERGGVIVCTDKSIKYKKQRLSILRDEFSCYMNMVDSHEEEVEKFLRACDELGFTKIRQNVVDLSTIDYTPVHNPRKAQSRRVGDANYMVKGVMPCHDAKIRYSTYDDIPKENTYFIHSLRANPDPDVYGEYYDTNEDIRYFLHHEDELRRLGFKFIYLSRGVTKKLISDLEADGVQEISALRNDVNELVKDWYDLMPLMARDESTDISIHGESSSSIIEMIDTINSEPFLKYAVRRTFSDIDGDVNRLIALEKKKEKDNKQKVRISLIRSLMVHDDFEEYSFLQQCENQKRRELKARYKIQDRYRGCVKILRTKSMRETITTICKKQGFNALTSLLV